MLEKKVEKNKKRVILVGINPNKVHGSAIYYLKAYVEKYEEIKQDYDIFIRVFNSLIPEQSNGIDLIIRKIVDYKPDVVAVSCYCWNIEITLKVIRTIKTIIPQVIIILGGPEVSGDSDRYLEENKSIDYIIDGEGELAFYEFLLAMSGKVSDIKDVHSLVYRNFDGIIVHNKCKILEDINDIPSIYNEDYLNPDIIGKTFYSYETKRGCQYKCQYCFHHGGIHCIREFDIERVKKEILYLLNSKLEYIWIVDPCFNENEERAIEILKVIQEHNINGIEFGFEIRNETLSERIIYEFSKISSVRFIAMGLQTLNIDALKLINRDFNKSKFDDNMKIIRRYFSEPDQIHIDLIFGLPNTTLQDYMDSIDYCINLGAVIFTQPLKVLSGTELKNRECEFDFVVNDISPHEVIANSTFSYEDMCIAKNINLGLYLFQLSTVIRGWIEEVQNETQMMYSQIFRCLGDYFWKEDKYYLFMNYVKYDLEFILNEVKDALSVIFGKVVEVDSENSYDQKVQIDWGSISNLLDYSEGL